MHTFNRRRFLGAASSALVLGFTVGRGTKLAQAQVPAQPAKLLPNPNAYLKIDQAGRIELLLTHTEMGQGIWTTLPMLMAEELGVPLEQVHVQHAPMGPAYVHAISGARGTGGSSTTRSEFVRYRQIGAMARDMLIQAAAQKSGVAADALVCEGGFVTGPGVRWPLGALVATAAQLPLPESVRLKERKDWQLIGQPTRRIDAQAKVRGAAQFGIDLWPEGVLRAAIRRPDIFGAKVHSFNKQQVLQAPGVRHVVAIPSGVAVVADTFWQAKKALALLEVQWDTSGVEAIDSAQLRTRYEALAQTPGVPALAKGEQGGGGGAVVERVFYVPFLAHATMEPLNCAVSIQADRCDVWVGTQMQDFDQDTVARITGLPKDKVFMHTPFLGGGFGRRANPTSDFVGEATHLAKAIGRPVQVVWTREDDIKGGYYRPTYVQRVKVALGDDGLPQSWEHTVVGQSLVKGTPLEKIFFQNGFDKTALDGVINAPFFQAVPNVHVSMHTTELPVTVNAWRSVGNSQNGFVMECMVDELAHASGTDPLAYRKKLYASSPRHLGVLDLVQAQSGWGQPLPAGHVRGIAVHECYGGVAAQVVEVSVEQGQLKVHRVVCAFDCGTIVNPLGVKAQVESSIVFALSAALYGEITLTDGRVNQSNFHDYPILRIHEMPRIDVHLVDTDRPPGGAGEPAVPPLAPALANAVFQLTGQRVTQLPIQWKA